MARLDEFLMTKLPMVFVQINLLTCFIFIINLIHPYAGL